MSGVTLIILSFEQQLKKAAELQSRYNVFHFHAIRTLSRIHKTIYAVLMDKMQLIGLVYALTAHTASETLFYDYSTPSGNFLLVGTSIVRENVL